MKKRIFSLLLACVMVISLLPTMAMAEETNVAQIGTAEYATLQAAVNAATNGDVIELLTDVEEGTITAYDYGGKSLTVDLKGKTWTARDGVAIAGTNIKFTLIDTVGNGVITNENTTGTSVEGEPTALIDLGMSSTATLNSGKLINKRDGLGTVGALLESSIAFNGTNVETDQSLIGGNCGIPELDPAVTITAGTFNVDPSDYVADGYVAVNNDDGTWTVKTPVAQIGENEYASLADAVAEAQDGDTITLLDNCSGDGIGINKSLTIDLNGKTYTVCGPTLAGSQGTKTQGFQLLKECGNITFKNGKIDTTVEANAKILIQNYANLTLDNVTLDGTNLTGTKYTSSNNNGTVVYKNSTKIIAAEGGVAFDAYDYATGGYDGVSVSIADASVEIDGVIEIDGDRSGGENKAEVKVPEGYVLYPVAEKQYVIKAESDYVAQIGEDKYFTLADAFDAANEAETATTITMIGDEMIDVNGTAIKINVGKEVVLDLSGHHVHGYCSTGKGSNLISNAGTLTVKDSTDTLNNGSGDGKLTYSANPVWNYEDSVQNSYASNLIDNRGTLTIESGYFQNESDGSTGSACYVVDNYAMSRDVSFTLTGGKLVNNTYTAVRFATNSTEKYCRAEMKGGIIESKYSNVINYNNKATPKADIKFCGTTVNGAEYALYESGAGMSGVNDVSGVKLAVESGKFTGNFDITKVTNFITGGLYSKTVPSAYVATGYACVDNTDVATKGDYPYVVKAVTTEVAEVKVKDNKIVVDEKPVEVEIKDSGSAVAAPTPAQLEAVVEEINTIITNPEVSTFEDTKIDETTEYLTTTTVESGSFNIAKILELVREEADKQYTASATSNDEIGVTVGGAEQTFTTEDVTTKITVDLTSTKVETTTTAQETSVVSATVSTMTFDVKPVATITVDKGNGKTEVIKAVIKNEDIQSPITFRLPVKDGWTEVRVSHNGIYKGTYIAQGEDGNRYVELASDKFSYWTVENNEFEDTDAVAKTETMYFDDLAEALEAATDGQTVTVLKDGVELDKEVFITNKAITLDLNNFTVKVNTPVSVTIPIHVGKKDSTQGAELTVENGTINGSAGWNVFGVYGMTTGGSAKRSLTLDGVTMNVTGGYAVAINNNSNHGYGAEITITDSTLKAPYVLSINGNIQDTTGNFPKVTLNNAKITATTDDVAIYAAGYAEWDIDNSTITGGTGIYAKAGKFDIDGGKIEATGAYAAPAPNGNGGNSTGDGIFFDSKTGYAGNMEVTLTNVDVSSVNGYAVQEALTDETETNTRSIAIDGGSYTSAVGKAAVATSETFDRAETTYLTVANNPVGVPAQTDLGKFTSFRVDYGDNFDYSKTGTPPTSRWDQFVNVAGGETAANAKTFENGDSIVNFATEKTGQQLTVHFGVTMGTVSYAVGEITDETEFKTIKDGDVLTLAQNGQPLVFQIECGSGVSNFFTFTPDKISISVPYTLHVKPVGAEVVDPTYTAGTDKYVAYGVYATVPYGTAATPIGSYDFTLSYSSAFTFDTADENCSFTPVNGTVENLAAQEGNLKIAVTLDTGIEPEVASSTPSYSALLGTLKLKVAENSLETISTTISGSPVVTPKGYDKNEAANSAVGHTQYLIKFTAEGATVNPTSAWVKSGTTPFSSATANTGWTLEGGHWDKDFAAATAPDTYHYTATHVEYTVTWTQNMTVVKNAGGTDEATLTSGDTMFYEDTLTITVTGLADKTVIRNGDFKYTLGTADATGVSRTGDSGFSYTVGPNVVNANVVLSYTTTEYVTVTFSGGSATTLKNDDQANDREDLTAYTLKGANEGDADALYVSVNDFIKGNNGTKYNIPMQVPNANARLVPPEALGNKTNQQWKDGSGAVVTNVVLEGTSGETGTNYSHGFTDDTTLTADAVNTYAVTFAAGDHGAIKETETPQVVTYNVDAGTTIAAILAGEAVDYTNGTAAGTPVVLPQTTPDNGYEFKNWTATVEAVNAATTITGNFEVAKYSIGVSDNAAFKNLAGADETGRISMLKNVTFKLMLKKDTRIESVSYDVAPNANGTAFAGKTSEPLTAVDGVYTIPKENILGDVTVTVVTKDTVKITVKSADTDKGTVGGTTAFVVDQGSNVSEWNCTGLTTAAEPGYEVEKEDNKIVFYTDASCTSKFEATQFSEATTLYVKFVDAKYVIVLDELVKTNDMEGITAEITTYYVTHGTDAKFKIDRVFADPQIITSVTYSVEGGVQNVLLTPDGDGYYTIPGERIIGKVTVTVKTLAEEANIDKPIKALFIKRDSTQGTGVENFEGSGAYMADVVQNGDMKILALVSEAFKANNYTTTNKFFQLANGTQLYWSPRYQAYVCWVPKTMKAADLDGFVKFDDSKTATEIINGGDINFDGAVDSADAGIVNDAIHDTREVPTSALQLFEMDVANTTDKTFVDGATIDANDVTWILKNTVGLTAAKESNPIWAKPE